MSDISYFESKPGRVTCNAEDVFNFVTDIRNFEQFIQKDTINDWQAEKESCSFNVAMVGTVRFRMSEKVKCNKVVFDGDALKKDDFSLVLHISETGNDSAEVKVSLNADLNPMMKMIAAKPIGQFLEILIKEMENFSGWKDTIE